MCVLLRRPLAGCTTFECSNFDLAGVRFDLIAKRSDGCKQLGNLIEYLTEKKELNCCNESYHVGSMSDWLKVLFLWWPYDHNRVILIQLPPSLVTLLIPWIRRFTMIFAAWWLRISSKFSGKKSKKQPENAEMDNLKRVRIHPKHSATVAFSWQDDKDVTNNKIPQVTNFSSAYKLRLIVFNWSGNKLKVQLMPIVDSVLT